MTLQTITVPPRSGQPAQGLVVLLHGWGANFQDLVGLAPYFNLPNHQFVFPDAPFPHPYNPTGRMWYGFPNDFCFASTPGFNQNRELQTSRKQLTELLQSLHTSTGIPPSRTILGGFSQGGAMTLDVGLDLPLAGLMVLSGYLHAPLQPQQTSLPPVLMMHGTQDSVVPITSARQARDSLHHLGATLQYQEFEMGHEIQPLVFAQIQTFVKEILADVKPQ